MNGLPVARPMAIASLLAVSCGCTTNLKQPKQLHDQGRFEAAAAAVQQVAAEPQDTIWVRLEQGKILQDAGRLEESNRNFEEAYAIRQSLDDAAVVSGSGAINNALIFVTDYRALDYEGTMVDRILMRQAVVVNHLLLGQFDLAAVVARSLEREQEQVRRAFEVEQANRQRAIEEAAKSRSLAVDAKSIESNASFQAHRNQLDSMIGESAKALLLPAAGFPAWVAFMADRSADQADDALKWLAEGPIPAAMLTGLSERSRAGGLGDAVYVYFEEGRAPERIDGSIGFQLAPGVRIPKVALPKLRSRSGGAIARLRISGGESVVDTETIGSVEAAVAAEFRERLIYTWGRPVLIAAFKIGLTVGAAASVDDDNARSLILIGGAIWNSLTMPDLRTWTTLPATQQAAVLPRPADGRLQFRVPSSSTPVKTVTVPPGPSFVYARWTGVGELAIQSVSLSPRRRNSMEENP